MTVLEAMERSGIAETTLVLAWIKDAIHHIKSNTKEDLKVNKQNIISGERDYQLPSDLIYIDSISILDTNDDNKYKNIFTIVNSRLHYSEIASSRL